MHPARHIPGFLARAAAAAAGDPAKPKRVRPPKAKAADPGAPPAPAKPKPAGKPRPKAAAKPARALVDRLAERGK